jgi:DNA-binding XRE family transcriptional regulator
MRTEVREARIKAGLTQAGLARLAGVQRKQVIALESGKNVTLATVERIAAGLPELQYLAIGSVTLRLAINFDESRKELTEANDLVQSVLDRIGGPIGARTRRPHHSRMVSAARLTELASLVSALARGTEPVTPGDARSGPQDAGAPADGSQSGAGGETE